MRRKKPRTPPPPAPKRQQEEPFHSPFRDIKEQLQAALERAVDNAKARPPEKPVVDDQQLRALSCGSFEQLRVRGDARRDPADASGAWNLQSVGAVVLEALRLEQAVELGDDLVAGGWHAGGGAGGVWNTPTASGRGAAW